MKSIVAFALLVACVAMVQSGCVRNYPNYDYSGLLTYEEASPCCGQRNELYRSGAPYVGPVYPYRGCGGCGSCSSCKKVHVPSCGGCGSCSSCKKVHVPSCGGCGSCATCKKVHVPSCGGCGSCAACKNVHPVHY